MQQFFQDILSSLTHVGDYIIYLAIAVVTVIGFIKCLVPLWTTSRALRRAIRKLQDEAGTVTDHPVWQENLFIGRRLRGCWLRFLQNAIQLDRRGLPCNVEDYVNDDTVTHGPGNAPLAELIPSLLTSLGILGTFMGMTHGLSGLDVTSTENMMVGIQSLLNGMHFAFGTSVAGVSCALVFNMLNRIAQGASYRAIDDFTESFTTLAMQRPLDNDVQLICQNQDRNHMLGNVSDALSNSLPKSVETAVRSGMQPITTAMSDFLRGATSAQIDGVQRIVNQFVEGMNRSLGGQFLSLGKTMAQLNQSQQISMDQLNGSLETTAHMMERVQQLHQVSTDILQQFEHYIAELGEARKRDEGFERNTSELLGQMHAASQEELNALRVIRSCQDELAASMHQFRQAASDSVKNLSEIDERHSASMHQAGSVLSDAGNRLSQSYDTFVQNVVEGISKSLGMFESSMNSMLQSLREDLAGGSSANASAQLTQIQRTLTSMVEIMKTSDIHTENKEA
ncbi:MAG: MotA/TolQ/ExbB proton channel family protein [Clostridia bacterium]|nr:MotA/TolQ/ExbB proton channel family protein [Clostridia bacterium]